jgi:hypothetical protein
MMREKRRSHADPREKESPTCMIQGLHVILYATHSLTKKGPDRTQMQVLAKQRHRVVDGMPCAIGDVSDGVVAGHRQFGAGRS